VVSLLDCKWGDEVIELCIDATKMNVLLFLYVVDEYDQFSTLLFLLEFFGA
jgi:hypothetical protein